MRILVYRYGLLAPIENADLVDSEMRKAHDYRNMLTEIERGRRAARRLADQGVEKVSIEEKAAEEAEAAVEAALKAVKAAKSKGRTRSVPEDLRDALNVARVKKRDAVAALRQARKDAKEDEGRAAEVERIEEAAKGLRTNARAHCAPYWGTYLLIEDADMAARKAPLYDGAEPNNPKFLRWNGEGAIGVQIQNGADWREIFDVVEPDGPIENGRYTPKVVSVSKDLRLRIEHQPHSSGREKQKRRFARLWMRVGSTADRKPIWAVFPMVVHREPPPGARIKRAVVQKRRIGPRDEWSVQITMEVPNAERMKAGGVVALDLGWRAMEDGSIRVGRWCDDAGKVGEIALPARAVSGLRYPEKLRSIRDKAFELVKARFAIALAIAKGETVEIPEALFEKAAEGEAASDKVADGAEILRTIAPVALPDWLLQATETLAQWRSENRLASLAQRWKKQRFEGDDALFMLVESWRYHDHHLWQWECDQRSGSLRHRREIYRIAASELQKRYDVLVLEGDDKGKPMDLAAMRRRPSAEEKDEGERSNATLAAPGELRLVLTNAFAGSIVEQKEGEIEAVRRTRVVYCPMKNTTRKCAHCDSIEEWDQKRELRHVCSQCGRQWDQDDNAAKNLLALYFGEGPIEPEKGAEKEGRWKRAKTMAQQKAASKATSAASKATSAASKALPPHNEIAHLGQTDEPKEKKRAVRAKAKSETKSAADAAE